jgi:asparagine synthase (glutamine-hydrolysing)
MCGICGVYPFHSAPLEKTLLKAMCDVIVHRGPDEEGFYIDRDIALGMRRLSIIDLSTGQQPIHNEDKTVWTVFNGEIYNYRELRDDLRKKGHVFYTNADTEVIVHLYEEYGEDFVTKLNGMFAIAVWDSTQQTLVLARDRIGIKPLCYYLNEEKLVFGSEIKSILTEGTLERKLCLSSLDYYLTYGYIPAPDTIFEGIKKLPPGHILICRKGKTHVKRYWDVSYENHQKYDENYYQERILEILRQSVKRRLMSDVPLGAFLSGGIDSSTVVGIMSQLMDQPVKTFSIGFEETEYNELSDAKRVAQHFHTQHTELIVRPNAIELLPKLVWAYDEPFADSSAIPTYYVSKLAREHVTVALSGDGGDELFGGYTRYIDDRKDAIFSRLPVFFRKHVLAAIGRRMPMNMHFKKYLQYIGKSDEQRYFQRAGMFPTGVKNQLYSGDVEHELREVNPYATFEEYIRKQERLTFLESLLYLDLKTYLPYDILTKVDIASMMNSLEVRVPLLDHELVEFAATIPVELKIKRKISKYILKKAVSKFLPQEVLYKRKQGFAIPLEHWFRTELKDFAYDILTSKKLKERGLFSILYIQNILDEHQSGRGDYSPLIWALMYFELWCQMFMDSDVGSTLGTITQGGV